MRLPRLENTLLSRGIIHKQGFVNQTRIGGDSCVTETIALRSTLHQEYPENEEPSRNAVNFILLNQ